MDKLHKPAPLQSTQQPRPEEEIVMSLPSKKRGAPGPVGPSSTKKPRTDAAEISIEECSMQISVNLSEEFSVFPKQLRDVIETGYKNEAYSILDKVKTGRPIVQHATYHIQRGAWYGHGIHLYKLAEKDVFPTVMMANVDALKQFVSKARQKKQFTRAASIDLAKPKYSGLHSVPTGNMGWGFDKFSCLSLRLTTIEHKQLKHEYIFVERRIMEVKSVKGDEKCQIVEDPNVSCA